MAAIIRKTGGLVFSRNALNGLWLIALNDARAIFLTVRKNLRTPPKRSRFLRRAVNGSGHKFEPFMVWTVRSGTAGPVAFSTCQACAAMADRRSSEGPR